MPTGKMNWFVDTNLLVYTLDPSEPAKRAAVGNLLRRHMYEGSLVLSQQSLSEFYRVITDRLRLVSREDGRRLVRGLMPFATAPLDTETMQLAWRIQDDEGFGWWDSLLVASALRANCAYFASEDLQAGRKLGSLAITNPFHHSDAHH